MGVGEILASLLMNTRGVFTTAIDGLKTHEIVWLIAQG
jgi:hypothetical protein